MGGWMDQAGKGHKKRVLDVCYQKSDQHEPQWFNNRTKVSAKHFHSHFPAFPLLSLTWAIRPTDRPTFCRFRFSSLHALDRQHKWMRSLLGRSGSLNNRVHMLSFLCYQLPRAVLCCWGVIAALNDDLINGRQAALSSFLIRWWAN